MEQIRVVISSSLSKLDIEDMQNLVKRDKKYFDEFIGEIDPVYINKLMLESSTNEFLVALAYALVKERKFDRWIENEHVIGFTLFHKNNMSILRSIRQNINLNSKCSYINSFYVHPEFRNSSFAAEEMLTAIENQSEHVFAEAYCHEVVLRDALENRSFKKGIHNWRATNKIDVFVWYKALTNENFFI